MFTFWPQLCICQLKHLLVLSNTFSWAVGSVCVEELSEPASDTEGKREDTRSETG